MTLELKLTQIKNLPIVMCAEFLKDFQNETNDISKFVIRNTRVVYLKRNLFSSELRFLKNIKEILITQ